MRFDLLSASGYPLVVDNYRIDDCGAATHQLTVELADKWYMLHVVAFSPTGRSSVQPLMFHAMNDFARSGESTYVDHCPNPEVVARYAEYHNLHIPELAMELMVGRWMIETTTYSPWECDFADR